MSSRRIIANRDKPIPVMDNLDLIVNISSVKPKVEFRYIARAIFGVGWAAAKVDHDLFGIDAILTKGLNIKYRGSLIFPSGIKSLNEFGDIAYDFKILSDSQATPNHHAIARLSFFKFTRNGLGLYVGKDSEFSIEVQDDLSGSSNTEVHVMLQGWRI